MAKQPVPEFNPYKAVTPVAQMTSFYRQPNILQVPDSGLGQIAEALQGLSPTLMGAIDDQAEAANKAQVDKGQMKAAELTPEQAREASKGQFANLEANGVIPKGASPFYLSGMQASIGKRAVEVDLRERLNSNLSRLSDPYSTEDVSSFVQSEFLGITKDMGFYAQRAATASLDNVERNFINRTSALRSQKRVEQSEVDLTQNIYSSIESLDEYTEPLERETFLNNLSNSLQAQLDEFHSVSGASGKNQAETAIEAVLKNMTLKEGDVDSANEVLDALKDLKIGSQRFEETSLFDDMSIQIPEWANSFEEKNVRKQARINVANERIIDSINYEIMRELQDDGSWEKTDLDGKEFQESLKTRLQEAGISQEYITASRGKVTDFLANKQDRETSNTDILFRLNQLANNGNLTKEDVDKNSQYLNDQDERRFTSIAGTLSSKSSKMDEMRSDIPTTAAIRLGMKSIEDLLSNDSLINNSGRNLSVMTEYGQRIQAALEIIAEKEITDTVTLDSLKSEAREKVKEITLEFTEWSEGKENILEGDAPDIFNLEEDRRMQADLRKSVPDDLSPEDSFGIDWPIEYSFMDQQDLKSRLDKKEISQEEYDKEVKENQNKWMSNAEETVKGLLIARKNRQFPAGFRTSRYFSKDERKVLAQTQSVIGFSLEMIKSKSRTYAGGRKETYEETVNFDDTVFDPRHSILFDNIKTQEDFLEVTKNNMALIEEVYEAIPNQFKTGLEDFINQQRSVIERRRPSTGDQDDI